jgi:hypothetical protein
LKRLRSGRPLHTPICPPIDPVWKNILPPPPPPLFSPLYICPIPIARCRQHGVRCWRGWAQWRILAAASVSQLAGRRNVFTSLTVANAVWKCQWAPVPPCMNNASACADNVTIIIAFPYVAREGTVWIASWRNDHTRSDMNGAAQNTALIWRSLRTILTMFSTRSFSELRRGFYCIG